MSITYFKPADLAAIAYLSTEGLIGPSRQKAVTVAAKALAAYSRCNAKAYNRTYRDGTARGYKTAEIVKAKPDEHHLVYASQTARLLVHNAVSNDGHDYLTPTVAKQLLGVVQRLLP